MKRWPQISQPASGLFPGRLSECVVFLPTCRLQPPYVTVMSRVVFETIAYTDRSRYSDRAGQSLGSGGLKSEILQNKLLEPQSNNPPRLKQTKTYGLLLFHQPSLILLILQNLIQYVGFSRSRVSPVVCPFHLTSVCSHNHKIHCKFHTIDLKCVHGLCGLFIQISHYS